MLIEKLSKEDIELVGFLHDPVFISECLFVSDLNKLDSLQYYKEDDFFKVRLYQLPFMSYDYLLAENNALSKAENFQLKKKSGSNYIFCGRGIGKTALALVDLCLDTIHNCFDWVTAVSSFDDDHVAGLLEPYIVTIKKHPFLKLFFSRATREPYNVTTLPNRSVVGVNMTLSGREPGCLDLETEILTNNGWKKYNTIKETDKVLSFNKDKNNSEYRNIKKIIVSDYNGTILHIKNKTIDLKVTPNHNLLSYIHNSKRWFTKRADEFNSLSFIPSCSEVKYKAKKNKPIIFFKRENFSNLNYIPYEVSIEDWIKFLAWFISEGNLTSEYQKNKKKYRIQISQSKENNFEKWSEISELLTRLGLNYNYHGCSFSFKNKYLYNLLEKLTIRYSRNKRIPRFIFKLDKTLIQLFADTYIRGDGHYYPEKHNAVIYSASLGLMEDFQELYTILGKNTSFSSRLSGFKNVKTGQSAITYTLFVNQRNKKAFYKRHIIKEDYQGKVWCVDTEPYHTIFVRRNGKIAIVGNSSWESIHCRKMIIDEAQYETDQVTQKRSQSVSEHGCIERFSGITSFRRLSPMGKIFFDLDRRNWLVNLPKSISPAWCENEKKRALDDYSDEGSPSYKIHIEAEVVENALGLYDIDLIRKTYLHNLHRPIKHFEVNKESFSFFKDKIIVERPTNAKRTWIAADFGAQAAPTEIIVIFEIETNDDKKLFKYIYNITLNNLIPDQQTEIFKYLVKELKADYVGIDRTELGGAQVLQDLNPLLPQERLIGVRFNEKILVGYEKDDNDILKIVDGKTIPIEEYVIDWAVEKTRELFYKQKIDCLYDMKLDKEFNAMVAVRQATRLKYSTLLANKQDHLHAAFLVFNIMRFLKEESLDNKIPTLTWGIGVVKTI